jgi:glycosyltransferase involved in cell wall biosynthesis
MSGLARYARQIHKALQADGHLITKIQLPDWFYREGGRGHQMLRFIALTTWEMLLPPLLLLFRKIDYHISPAFAAPLGLLSRRYLVVVHDLAFIDYPDMYTRLERWYLGMNLRLMQIGCHTIIVPSYFVKSRICDLYGISAQRIHTVSPYSEFMPRAPESTKPDRYFILLSNAHPRKNLKATLEGFLTSAAYTSGYKLMVVGNFEYSVLADADHVVFYHGVNDQRLEQMIAGASALVLFSLSEGFGFPIVEAASLGVVSMTSEVSSLTELLPSDARLIKATQPHEIRAVFNRFVEDPAFRARLEENRRYVNATFNSQIFQQRWKELLSDQ